MAERPDFGVDPLAGFFFFGGGGGEILIFFNPCRDRGVPATQTQMHMSSGKAAFEVETLGDNRERKQREGTNLHCLTRFKREWLISSKINPRSWKGRLNNIWGNSMAGKGRRKVLPEVKPLNDIWTAMLWLVPD